MKFMVLIYNDTAVLDGVPSPEFNATMRDCLAKADEMRHDGRLIESQMLAAASTAKTMRVRNGRMKIVDGPFAETKEVLGGFNLIEARDMDEALEIAAQFPWARTGAIEVRAVRDIDTVREKVGAAPFTESSRPYET